MSYGNIDVVINDLRRELQKKENDNKKHSSYIKVRNLLCLVQFDYLPATSILNPHDDPVVHPALDTLPLTPLQDCENKITSLVDSWNKEVECRQQLERAYELLEDSNEIKRKELVSKAEMDKKSSVQVSFFPGNSRLNYIAYHKVTLCFLIQGTRIFSCFKLWALPPPDIRAAV